MCQEFQLKLPMRMKVNQRGEVESLNLNVYRNLHFRKLSFQKNAFQKRMSPLLSGFPKLGKVKLHYEIHPKSEGRLDTMNVGSIVDKYFSDALVEAGVIQDDDYKNVVFNSFCFGSVSPKDPHVLVTITETEPRKDNSMRILLDQTEIQQALEDFVQTMGLSGISGVELSANQDGEITAEVVMGVQLKAVGETQRETSASTIRPKRGGRPVGSKNKPKESDGNVVPFGSSSDDGDSAGSSESTEEEDLQSEADDNSDEEEEFAVNSKNPSGDLDTESSSQDNDDEEEGTGAEVPVVERVRKSSIFDE